MKRDKIANVAAVLCVLLAAANAVVMVRGCGHEKDGAVPDTVRKVFVDTVKYLQPVVRDSVVVKCVKVRVPRADSVNDTLGGRYKNSGGTYKNSDSAEVVIPITQKRYSDTTYMAWVSGFRPALDSIHVYPRREVVTITNTVRDKSKRWGVGFHAGYGFTPHGLQPYIGVGLNYSILDF